MSERRLAGRVAIVTGAAQGIGRGIAKRLAAEGARVLVADIDEVLGQRTAAEVSGVFCHANVSLEADIAAMVAMAVEQFGGLDILVNNAGITPSKPFEEADSAYWHHTVDLNLTSMFLTANYAQTHLQQSAYGNIVNIASIHAFMTVKNASTYAASKGGVLALTRGLALELAPKVRVNAITPGLIETERIQVEWEGSPDRAEQLAVQPLKRFGLPADIGAAVAFLVSDEAGFITGSTLAIDGGVSVQLDR